MPKKKLLGRITFRVEPGLEEQINEMARKKSMFVTGWVRQACEEKLQRDK